MPEPSQQRGCGPLTETGKPGNAIGVVPDERQQIWDRFRLHSAAVEQRLLVDHALADHVHLHDVVRLQALPQVLVRREDADLVDLSSESRRCRGERVIGLELAHRPDHRSDGTGGLLGGVELRPQLGRHAFVRLVLREEIVAKRSDRVVEGHRQVGDLLRRVGQQREQRLRHAQRRLQRLLRPLRIVCAEELEGTVHQVQAHGRSISQRSGAR